MVAPAVAEGGGASLFLLGLGQRTEEGVRWGFLTDEDKPGLGLLSIDGEKEGEFNRKR